MHDSIRSPFDQVTTARPKGPSCSSVVGGHVFHAERARVLVEIAQSWRRGVYPRHTELYDVTKKLRVLLDGLLADAEARAAQILDGSPARQTLTEAIADARGAVAGGPGIGLCSGINHARTLADITDRLLQERRERSR